MERADFHIHYNPISYQEATRTAQEAINFADKANVRAVALLARGQIVDYFDEFVAYGKEKNVQVVTGIEHLAILPDTGVGVDLVCLGFDHKNDQIKEYFGSGEQRRLARIAGVQVRFLETRGFSFGSLSPEDQELLKTIKKGQVVEKAIHLCEMVSSLGINKPLLDQMITDNWPLWRQLQKSHFQIPYYKDSQRKQLGKFLYKLYFDIGKEGHLKVVDEVDEVLPVEDVIKIIHRAGGVVLYSPEGDYDDKNWQELCNLKVDGIMAWHGGRLGYNNKGKDVPTSAIKKALKSGLLVLGGSDYQEQNWKVGNGDGEMSISIRRFGELNCNLDQKRTLTGL